MITCSMNQSKPYLSTNIVYSHLNERSAESARAGFLRKNNHAVNTPNAANHTGSAQSPNHTNPPGPRNSPPPRGPEPLIGRQHMNRPVEIAAEQHGFDREPADQRRRDGQ